MTPANPFLVVLAALSFVVTLVFAPAEAMPPMQGELVIEEYNFSEPATSQAGVPFKDAAGKVFLVGRTSSRRENNVLMVELDGRCLTCHLARAKGSPSAYIDPTDGYLWVGVRKDDDTGVYRIRVPEWSPFGVRTTYMPQVQR